MGESAAGAIAHGIPEDLVSQLRTDLAQRRIARGMARLEACRDLIESFRPEMPNAAAFLSYLAQWVDIGFAQPALIKRLLDRFPKDRRAELPLIDYVHLRMAEALAAMDDEEYDCAIAHLQFVLSIASEVRDRELIAIANFWIGRALRTQGRYDDALGYTTRGRDIALELGFAEMAAVMQSLESWLRFQEGRLREAARILNQAEAVLGGCDDRVLRGNIQSAYGRIARREGRYDEAVHRFAASIEEYREHDPLHRNLARSLVNMASCKRLIALRLQQRINREARRPTRDRNAGVIVGLRGQYQTLREEAFAELQHAGEIYRTHPHHHGAGAVHLNCGFLHLDSGDLERAVEEATSAFTLGQEKKDYILMGRARILECMIENARLEEEIGDPAQHAQRAYSAARDAVEYAGHTQNRRLIARARIWEGLTLSNEFFGNIDGARECAEAAETLLKSEARDYLRDDLETLKRRLVRPGSVERVLEEWSQGIVGDKTFQQITEDFASVVIPKVWEREGRKVSRVAAKLSISPKKVRRILSRLGLLPRGRVH